ncbi:MAG: UDP-N-acetylmuramate--L-alanine ligase [Acidimicrobiales bacterium]
MPDLSPALPDERRALLEAARRVHVVGVGGSGMSAIARVLVGMGFEVSGSDAHDSATLGRLAAAGVDVRVGNYPEAAEAADLVVSSTAVPSDDPDIDAARRAGVTTWSRAELLSAVCATKRTIAVSGTHGKTTTSAMTAVVLSELGWRPSWIVGSEINGFGPGGHWDPGGDWLVVEADESDGTFTTLPAYAAVVTNVDADHVEFYGSVEALEAEFVRFAAQAGALSVVCADDPGARRVVETLLGVPVHALPRRPPVVTYGTSPSAEVRVEDVDMNGAGSRFAVRVGGVVPPGDGSNPEGPLGSSQAGSSGAGSGGSGVVEVVLDVPGAHNVLNAAAVVTLVAMLGASPARVGEAVRSFRGVARRFERRGGVAGVTFVDGYDHLPGEVAAAIATAKLGTWSRVVVVFQPHRYSRTEALWAQFGASFAGADVVVITGLYPAGENPRPGVDERLIFDALRSANPEIEAYHSPSLTDTAGLLARILKPGDLCLTLGAGDVTEVGEMVIAALAGRQS